MKEQMAEEGVISVRECPACGHHEVGFTDRSGTFHPLRPGQRVFVIREDEPVPVPSPETAGPRPGPDPSEPETGADAPDSPWVPEPLLKKASFRAVFGVLVKGTGNEEMTPAGYLAAYMEKIRGLIACEPSGDLAATLDRHFVASHLAAGPPERIAENLWRELDEIRAPVRIVASWLKGEDEDILARAEEMAFAAKEPEGPPPDREDIRRELDQLDLDAFFSLLG